MDFSSIENFPEYELDALYQETVSSGDELAGIYCYHTSRMMRCECVSSGGYMAAWYGYKINGYASKGSYIYAQTYSTTISSCSWTYGDYYRAYEIRCYSCGYATNSTNVNGGHYLTANYCGYAILALEPSTHCR